MSFEAIHRAWPRDAWVASIIVEFKNLLEVENVPAVQ
jgi:hypothetical protein